MATKHTKGVIDLTFHDIKNEADMAENMRAALSELHSLKAMGMSTTGEAGNTSLGSPTRRMKQEEITAVRLSNNLIESMDHISNPFMTLIDTSKVLWLDLSFNKISSVSESFHQFFPHVKTIYCHANSISKLSEIKKFALFKELKSLSLYGNRVEEHKHYRNYVLYMCPGLTQFDSSPVTATERKRMEVWAMTFRRKLQPEES